MAAIGQHLLRLGVAEVKVIDTYDLQRLCCAARFIASLPTLEQMTNTGRSLIARYGHDPKAINDQIRSIRRKALEQHVDR